MNTMSMIATAASALTLVAATASPVEAEAQTWKVGSGFVIRAHDLDLSSAEDRERLLKRVEFASERICANAGARQRRNRCVEQTMATAQASTSASILRALELAEAARGPVQLAGR